LHGGCIRSSVDSLCSAQLIHRLGLQRPQLAQRCVLLGNGSIPLGQQRLLLNQLLLLAGQAGIPICKRGLQPLDLRLIGGHLLLQRLLLLLQLPHTPRLVCQRSSSTHHLRRRWRPHASHSCRIACWYTARLLLLLLAVVLLALLPP
jgi:hypothetical protein